jgi:hypothetical protein
LITAQEVIGLNPIAVTNYPCKSIDFQGFFIDRYFYLDNQPLGALMYLFFSELLQNIFLSETHVCWIPIFEPHLLLFKIIFTKDFL